MKKIFYAAMAATMLFATSCSEALDDVQNTGKMATVSVNLDLPTIQTRAYSDGSKATQLQYAVYDKTSGVLSILDNYTKTAEMEGGKATVNFQLVTGHTYGFVFWAANAKAPYTVNFDTNGASMSVDYTEIAANDEKLDAFYAYEEFEVNDDFSATVKLYRPFAQLNIGTSDYAAAKAYGYEPTQSSITVSGVYSSFDLMSGEVLGETQEVTYNFGNIQKGQTFPVEGYKYLAMAYILAAQDKEVVDVTFSYTDGKSIAIEHPTIGSVPVQRNHRTNIFGQILTSNGELEVEIKPGFDDTDYNTEYPEGDGYTYDETTKTYTVTTAKGLMAVYEKTLGSAYTVKLGADLDLNGSAENPWTPLDAQSTTFDGQNHTITGLYVDQTANENANAGLFSGGFNKFGTYKNLTIKNPVVKGNYKVGAVAGDGLCSYFENITVTGATIVSTPWKKDGAVYYDDGNNAGGIVGYFSAEGNGYIKNCTVENSTIKAYRTVGGITGNAACYANSEVRVMQNCTVKNTTVIADMTETNYDGFDKRLPCAGELVGQTGTNYSVDETNKAENVTVSVLKGSAENAKTVEITNIGDLNLIASMGEAYYKGKTIVFPENGVIDLSGKSVEPVGFWSPENKVTIDFNGTTIKNLDLTSTSTSDYSSCIFGRVTADIKNLTIEGMTANVKSRFAGIVGNLYGTMENVHVKDVKLTTTDGRLGALVGIHNGGKLIDCSVEDCEITGGWSVGGMVGATNETAGIEYQGCTVKDVKVTNTAIFGGVYNYMGGPITGNINIEGGIFSNCTITNCTVNDEPCTLPIWHSYKAYTFNDQAINPDIDNKGNFIE